MEIAFIDDLQDRINVTEADIHSVERRYNIKFPEVLSFFYMEYCGCSIRECFLEIEKSLYRVFCIFPLSGDAGDGVTVCELKDVYNETGDLEPWFYPIADNGGEGLYLWHALTGEVWYMPDEGGSPKEFLFASIDEFFAAMNEAVTKGRYRRNERMSKIDFKPLGSVVLLKGGLQRMMIVARGLNVENEGETYFFDYGAVPYPDGLTGDQMAYFDHSAIARVFFEGYRDDDNEIMVDRLNQYIKDNPGLKRKTFETE